MLIKSRNDGFTHPVASEITPQGIYTQRRELIRLFPGCGMRARSLTLLPPLTRRLGRWTEALYPILARVPFLRTHNLTCLKK